MAHVTVAYALLVILSMSLLDNADAQSANVHDSFSVIKSLDGLTKAVGDLRKVVEKLETKIETQGTLLNTLEGKIETQATVLANVEGKVVMQATLLNNWMTNASVQAALLLNTLELQATVLNNLDAQAKAQSTLIHNLVSNEGIQATSLQKLEALGEFQATSLNNLKNLSTNVQTLRTETAKLSKDFHKMNPSKGVVEGIIAGTNGSVVVIPLSLREEKKISRVNATGVAFDWSTRKVYYIHYGVGIRRSNLDGTALELLIADTQDLWGLAVDTVTGNFYYGKRPPTAEIRACSRSGKNCSVVVSGANLVGEKLFDIALHPSEGIMFWSNVHGNKTVMRANMDGTHTTAVIASRITDGIYTDELSERLYWSEDSTRIIGSNDLKGNNPKIHLNATLSPGDIAVDGDTVYFGNWNDKSVYSVNGAGALSLIANTTGQVRHIALYGRNKVPSRPNPCENSPCPNVCVLNWASYTCL